MNFAPSFRVRRLGATRCDRTDLLVARASGVGSERIRAPRQVGDRQEPFTA